MRTTIVTTCLMFGLAPAAWAQEEGEAQAQPAEQPAADDDVEETLHDFEETDESNHKPPDEEEAEWLTDTKVEQTFGEEDIPAGGGLFAPPEEGQKPARMRELSATRKRIVEIADVFWLAGPDNHDVWMKKRGENKARRLVKAIRWRSDADFDEILKIMWTLGVRQYRVGDIKTFWPIWNKHGKLPKHCPHTGKSIRIVDDETRCPFNEAWWKSKKKKPEWCAAFVSLVWRAAMGDDTPVEVQGYVPWLKRNLEAKGLFVAYTGSEVPEPGDILFETNGAGNLAHVGLVTLVWSDGRFWMIEGNAGDRMNPFEYTLGSKRRKRIAGFGKPEPSAAGGDSSGE